MCNRKVDVKGYLWNHTAPQRTLKKLHFKSILYVTVTVCDIVRSAKEETNEIVNGLQKKNFQRWSKSNRDFWNLCYVWLKWVKDWTWGPSGFSCCPDVLHMANVMLFYGQVWRPCNFFSGQWWAFQCYWFSWQLLENVQVQQNLLRESKRCPADWGLMRSNSVLQ